MVVEVVDATEDHCRAMAPHMKKADVDEVLASGARDPLHALIVSFRSSTAAWVMLEDGEPIAMAGVSPLSMLGGIGVPWMLGTERVNKNGILFLRESKKRVREMLNTYTLLINYVDERHVVAKRWLDWLGFTIEEALPFPKTRVPF